MIGRMGSHEPLQAIDIWSVGCIYVETSVVKAFKSQLRSYFKVPTEAELLGMLEGTRTQARSDVQITVGISVFHCSLEVTPSHPIPVLRDFGRCHFQPLPVCHCLSCQDRGPLFPGSSCFPLSPDHKHKLPGCTAFRFFGPIFGGD